ncbi:MAG TPA: D-alanyl-D-alanine carboxypeptidase family protein [Rhizomicrobium sp.]|nr:D-alanyl-D-alanine carboxypeptidase family protein [Rhizomicrobium sp.]
MRRLFVIAIAFAAALISPAQATVDTTAEHAILMDADSGQVLWAKDAYTPMPPASMSKLMTLELLFQRLKDGRVKLSDKFPVSQRAWSERSGSEMFVKLGDSMTVEDLIRGIIVMSANDGCIVVAEAIGGTEENFIAMMNARAKQLGLNQSHFVNPNGLPDPPGQLMSAADLATLARHMIRDYPAYYHYFSERSFVWSGISQENRNLVLEKFPGADGLKTGHTDAAGYGITTSAVQNGARLVLVLNGLRYPDLAKRDSKSQDWFAEQRRAEEAARILGVAFREFRRYQLFKADDIVGKAVVWQGDSDSVPLKLAGPLSIMLPVDAQAGMKATLKYNGPVHAPVALNQRIGTLRITAPDFPGMDVPVYAAGSVGSAGIFGRIFLGLRSLISPNSTGQ